MKLRRQNQNELGTFETLETLALGIMGKAKLWQALQIAASIDRRLAGLDFARLEQRAIAQHDAVEAYRRRLATVVFAPEQPGVC